MDFYDVTIVTGNHVSPRDVHKMLMSCVADTDLNKAAPRADAGMLFRVMDRRKFSVEGSPVYSTTVRVSVADSVRFVDTTKVKFTRLADTNAAVSSFSCVMSALYTPMVELSSGEREALEFMGAKAPKRVSSGRKVAYKDTEEFIVSKVTSVFANKRVSLKNVRVDNADSRASGNRFVRMYTLDAKGSSVPVVSFSAEVDYDSTEPGAVDTLLAEGIGKCKNYGLGMIAPAHEDVS